MEPAQTIINLFGGEAAIAAVAGTAVSAPYRWRSSREQGGTGGLIPQRHHPSILAFARANGIRLDASDFLPVSAEYTPSPDDSPARAAGSSADPKSQISESPQPVPGHGDRAVTPPPSGG